MKKPSTKFSTSEVKGGEKKVKVRINPPFCWMKHKMRNEPLCKGCLKYEKNNPK